MQNDLTFFTNEPGSALLDRFKRTLRDVKFFDILVGYFRTSGFDKLHESFATIDKIRILVGLNVDWKAFEIIDACQSQSTLDFESHKRTKEIFSEAVTTEMDRSPDSFETELGVRKFIEFLRSGKMEIKAYPSGNLHAKVYISRFGEDNRDFGRVITGSSNFSEGGLIANREFNVELKNRADVEFALARFEELWKDAVDLSREYTDTIHDKTWLNDEITPYHLYLKFLYEHFREDINIDEDFETFLPEGFVDEDGIQNRAEYVLDATINLFVSADQKQSSLKSPNYKNYIVNLRQDNVPIYEKADRSSNQVGTTPKGLKKIVVDYTVSGLKKDGLYWKVRHFDEGLYLCGYIADDYVDQ